MYMHSVSVYIDLFCMSRIGMKIEAKHIQIDRQTDTPEGVLRTYTDTHTQTHPRTCGHGKRGFNKLRRYYTRGYINA